LAKIFLLICNTIQGDQSFLWAKFPIFYDLKFMILPSICAKKYILQRIFIFLVFDNGLRSPNSYSRFQQVVKI
jgi:hypothetical protein